MPVKPVKTDARLEAAIETWPLWASEKPEVVRAMQGGLTNRTYLLKDSAGQYALRLNAPHSEALGIDRLQERTALEQASSSGFAPQILYCNLEQGVLVTRFLTGKPWRESDFLNPDRIHQLVHLLKNIHRQQIPGKALDLQQKISGYLQAAEASPPLAKALKRLQPRITHRIQEARILGGTHCLCHNDLVASNLIQTGSRTIHAIDWEYAAMGDPFFELAVIMEGNRLDEPTARLLLAAYAGEEENEMALSIRITDAEQRLSLHRTIYNYIDLFWYAARYASNATTDNEDEVIQKLEFCLGL